MPRQTDESRGRAFDPPRGSIPRRSELRDGAPPVVARQHPREGVARLDTEGPFPTLTWRLASVAALAALPHDENIVASRSVVRGRAGRCQTVPHAEPCDPLPRRSDPSRITGLLSAMHLDQAIWAQVGRTSNRRENASPAEPPGKRTAALIAQPRQFWRPSIAARSTAVAKTMRRSRGDSGAMVTSSL